MLASYLYQGEVPTTGQLFDMLVKLLVAAENSDVDADTAQEISAGLVRAYMARGTKRTLDFKAAETLYHREFVQVYCDRLYGEQRDVEGVGWWPEGLPHDIYYCGHLIVRLARLLAEIDVDRTKQTWKLCKERGLIKEEEIDDGNQAG